MKSGFTCITSKLLATLKCMKPALPKGRVASMRITCEITVTTNQIRLVIPGATHALSCIETSGTCKFTIPFVYFYKIIQDHDKTNFEAIIEPSSLKLSTKTSIDVRTTFFDDDKILRSIDLPFNHSPKDILYLVDKHTIEELLFNRQSKNIMNTIYNIDRDVRNAYKLLKKYEVTEQELMDLVERKLK